MTTTSNNTISVDQFIARSPERVWHALTDPDEIARWWVPGNIAATVGHQFTLAMPGWGDVACEVLDAIAPERLAFTFGEWTLTWTLVPEGVGTRLMLEHSGFDLDRPGDRFAFDNMGPGWRDEVLPRLATLCESTD